MNIKHNTVKAHYIHMYDFKPYVESQIQTKMFYLVYAISIDVFMGVQLLHIRESHVCRLSSSVLLSDVALCFTGSFSPVSLEDSFHIISFV